MTLCHARVCPWPCGRSCRGAGPRSLRLLRSAQSSKPEAPSPRFSPTRRELLTGILLLGSGCSHAGASTAQITVDASMRHQTMDGWSTEERLWDDPHLTNTFRAPRPEEEPFGRSAVEIPSAVQENILGKMYGELGLTQVHVVVDTGSQDQRGALYDFRWKLADGHIEWVRTAIKHGLQRWALFFAKTEDWMSRTDPADLAGWEMAHLRRWKAQGLEPQFVFPFSEPSYNQNDWKLSPQYMLELIRLLGRGMAAEGFRTRVATPDDLNPQLSLQQLEVLMADEEVRNYIAVISTHLYEGVTPAGFAALAQIRDRFARRYNKALWMSEFFRGPGGLGGSAFDYAELMHDLISKYYVAHINYEWAYFGQWEDQGIHFLHLTYDKGNNYTGFVIDKTFYTFGQFSRFIPPGSVRISAQANNPHIKATAYSVAQGKTIIIVVVKNTDGDTPTNFKLSNVSASSVANVVRTSEHEDWALIKAPTVSRGHFTTTLKGRSVSTFVLRVSG